MNFPNVEEIWAHLKKSLLETSSEVCGKSLNHQYKRQTWWWNASVADAVNEKKNRYKAFKKLKIQGLYNEANIAKKAHNESKRVAKRLVWLAKSEAERDAFSAITSGRNEIYNLARQMDSRNRDVIGDKCVTNDAGELTLSDAQKINAWVEHHKGYQILSSIGLASVSFVSPIFGPPPSVTLSQVSNAINEVSQNSRTFWHSG